MWNFFIAKIIPFDIRGKIFVDIASLTKNLSCKIFGQQNFYVDSLEFDCNKCKPNSLYFCLTQDWQKSKEFCEKAIKNGAKVVVSSFKIENKKVCQIVCENTRIAMSVICKNFYKCACDKLKIIGIVGTNGKTTTSYMVKSLLETRGKKVGLIGTNAVYIGKIMLKPTLTTPDPTVLHKLFLQMLDFGCEYVVMEVSAHAIFFEKIYGIKFACLAMTNITQDHLDFFKTFENYKNTKLKIFKVNYSNNCVLNSSLNCIDEIDKKGKNIVTFGFDKGADIFAKNIKCDIKKSVFKVCFGKFCKKTTLFVPSKYNVENFLCAVGILINLGFDFLSVCKNSAEINQVPGRFNLVEAGQNFDIVVDYAHTPDGLKKVLENLRATSHKKLFCVFGCGGNRDSEKRAIMGKIASEICDFVVITSDNPRFENPNEIIDQIASQIKKTNFAKIQNRFDAIKFAMDRAKRGDCILVAGKGHEDYQEIMGKKKHFCDVEAILEIAKNQKAGQKRC